ncbi:hypothetical protein POG22_01005 [Geitlerinema sp. CS-897]|nr:hypothetical protein [Baaleninema simplex]MDC0831588.1 hypothetical protein [Geitlerinema sp. CS-897]
MQPIEIESAMTSLATEFAEEDCTLTEAGMGDDSAMLDRED